MHEQVKTYYGQTLQSSADLQTSACCTTAAPPEYVKRILGRLHDEVLSRYYGCGLIAPAALEGCTVLDLGCGAGRDAYCLSALVGESGRVTGVDMTVEQLAVARRHQAYHAEAFGYAESNLEFLEGEIEALDRLGLESERFDVLVSNCVINLVPDKARVLREAWRVLKPGGELYFSDVYADRRVPAELAADPELYGECLSGALYWGDFLGLAKAAGFADPRLVEDRPLQLNNPRIAERIGHIGFFSATYRLFKLEGLEPACEDYGQAVVYRGSLAHQPQAFRLDKHHVIERGKVFPVCGNTYRMLKESRFAEHFQFIGDFSTHYGIFAGCGSLLPFDPQLADASGGCC
ncbi:MAG: methyltransferase domain-containing protein [Pseudomonas sp.]|uniref:methyltransferase domain-containing protein n=1 Tax=Pseudomonas sp. TaxID=306 RepID=UPI00339B88B5